MESKVCTGCNVERPVEEFSWRSKKNGIRHTICKVCHAAYRKQHYADNIEKYKEKARRWNGEFQDEKRRQMKRWVFEYLLAHPCVDCGESDPVVLQFDHVRGKKEHNISILMSQTTSIKRMKTEIEKCEVRCANCHARRTAETQGWYFLELMEEYRKSGKL